MSQQPEIRRNCTIVADGPKGGILDLVSPDGEVVHRFHVPQGRHRASQWLDLVEPEYALQVSEGCVCFQPRMGAVVSGHPEALASDANPDFQPTSQYRFEREMRAELAQMRELRLGLQKEAKLRALEKVDVVETIPDNPEPQAKDKDDDKP